MRKLRLVDAVMMLLYKAALDISFGLFVKPVYGNQPEFLEYGPENVSKLAIGYLVTLLCLWLFWAISKRSSASRFVIFVQLIFIVVPYTTLYGFEDLPTFYLSLVLAGYVSVALLVKVIPSIRLMTVGPEIRYVFACTAALVMIYVFAGLVVTGGLGRLNFNLYDIYPARAEYVKDLLPGFGYLVMWTAYVFIPVLLVIFLLRWKQRRLGGALGVVLILSLQLLLFGMTNFKTFLFLPVAIVGMLWLAWRVDMYRAMLIGVIGTICMLLFIDTLSPYALGLLNRTFFTPAAIHNLYFQYFSSHPFALLSGKPVGNWLGAPYSQFPVQLIAEHYWGTSISPNVGWIGDAYANFGVLGVFVYGTIMALVLRLGDSLARKISEPGAIEALLIAPAVALCSSALGTTLLTHGFIVLLAVLWVAKVNDWRATTHSFDELGYDSASTDK